MEHRLEEQDKVHGDQLRGFSENVIMRSELGVSGRSLNICDKIMRTWNQACRREMNLRRVSGFLD